MILCFWWHVSRVEGEKSCRGLHAAAVNFCPPKLTSLSSGIFTMTLAPNNILEALLLDKFDLKSEILISSLA
jgi:hypothetical protein